MSELELRALHERETPDSPEGQALLDAIIATLCAWWDRINNDELVLEAVVDLADDTFHAVIIAYDFAGDTTTTPIDGGGALAATMRTYTDFVRRRGVTGQALVAWVNYTDLEIEIRGGALEMSTERGLRIVCDATQH